MDLLTTGELCPCCCQEIGEWKKKKSAGAQLPDAQTHLSSLPASSSACITAREQGVERNGNDTGTDPKYLASAADVPLSPPDPHQTEVGCSGQ